MNSLPGSTGNEHGTSTKPVPTLPSCRPHCSTAIRISVPARHRNIRPVPSGRTVPATRRCLSRSRHIHRPCSPWSTPKRRRGTRRPIDYWPSSKSSGGTAGATERGTIVLSSHSSAGKPAWASINDCNSSAQHLIPTLAAVPGHTHHHHDHRPPIASAPLLFVVHKHIHALTIPTMRNDLRHARQAYIIPLYEYVNRITRCPKSHVIHYIIAWTCIIIPRHSS